MRDVSITAYPVHGNSEVIRLLERREFRMHVSGLLRHICLYRDVMQQSARTFPLSFTFLFFIFFLISTFSHLPSHFPVSPPSPHRSSFWQAQQVAFVVWMDSEGSISTPPPAPASPHSWLWLAVAAGCHGDSAELWEWQLNLQSYTRRLAFAACLCIYKHGILEAAPSSKLIFGFSANVICSGESTVKGRIQFVM